MPATTMTGKELAVERFKSGVTGKALAEAIGIHRSTLSMYENGWRALPEGFEGQYLRELMRLAREK